MCVVKCRKPKAPYAVCDAILYTIFEQLKYNTLVMNNEQIDERQQCISQINWSGSSYTKQSMEQLC